MELVELLVSAFPYPQPPEATLALYRDELELLDDAEIALEAIRQLYRDPEAKFLPSIGAIHDAYWHCQRAAAEERDRDATARGLPPGDYPPPPPEVVERFAAMGIDLRSIKPIPDDGTTSDEETE
jgi:hypothetical protein